MNSLTKTEVKNTLKKVAFWVACNETFKIRLVLKINLAAETYFDLEDYETNKVLNWSGDLEMAVKMFNDELAKRTRKFNGQN